MLMFYHQDEPTSADRRYFRPEESVWIREPAPESRFHNNAHSHTRYTRSIFRRGISSGSQNSTLLYYVGDSVLPFPRHPNNLHNTEIKLSVHLEKIPVSHCRYQKKPLQTLCLQCRFFR